MKENPYRFLGPIDPLKDPLVTVSRAEQIGRVVTGIQRGDCWAIFAPRQSGRTSFLYLLEHAIATGKDFPNWKCVYIDLGAFDSKGGGHLFEFIQMEILRSLGEDGADKARDQHGADLLGFLRALKTTRRLVLLFDGIKQLPRESSQSLLTTLRAVFNQRSHVKEFQKYYIVITGATDLARMTLGATSPFNIAQTLYLPDFTKEECHGLMDVARQELGIEFEEGARQELISWTSGHPCLTQHLCYSTVEHARKNKQVQISIGDVQGAVDRLFTEDCAHLRFVLAEEDRVGIPEELIKRLMSGKPLKFTRLDKAIGEAELTGLVTNRNENCAIRNRIYERLLSERPVVKTEGEPVPVEEEQDKETEPAKGGTGRRIGRFLGQRFVSILDEVAAGLVVAGIALIAQQQWSLGKLPAWLPIAAAFVLGALVWLIAKPLWQRARSGRAKDSDKTSDQGTSR